MDRRMIPCCKYNAGLGMTQVATSVRTLSTLFTFPVLLSSTSANFHHINLLPDYQHLPTYSHNISTSSTPSNADFPLPLSTYRKYSPCELQLLDPDSQGSESVTSIAIFISQYTNASTQGVTWSLDHAAPKVAVDAGVATAETGSAAKGHNGAAGAVWAVVGAMVVATVLF